MPISGGFWQPDNINPKKEKSMKNENVVRTKGHNAKKSHKRITPEQLQEIFLNIARKVADDFLESCRKEKTSDFYANRPDAFNDDFFGLFDQFTQWKQEIRDGYLLRILKYIGAYDGSKIDKKCLLTALRVICFIGRYSDNRNGDFLTVKGGSLEIPYDDVARLERYVRNSV